MCKCATDGCSSRFGIASDRDMSTNQPARADSTLKSGTVAGNAVDGDTSQNDYEIMWHSANKGSDCSAFQARSWWGVELKRALDYFNVKIYARDCCNGNGSEDIEVLVSNSFPTNGQDFTSFNGATASCGQLNGFGAYDYAETPNKACWGPTNNWYSSHPNTYASLDNCKLWCSSQATCMGIAFATASNRCLDSGACRCYACFHDASVTVADYNTDYNYATYVIDRTDPTIKNIDCRMDQEYRYVILRPKTCSGLSYHYFHIAEVEVTRKVPNADSYSIQSSTSVPGAVAIYTPVILETNTYCTVQATMSYVAQNTPEECAEYCGAEGYTGFFMNHEYPNTMCKCSTDGCVTRYSSNYHADAYEIQVTNGESKTVTSYAKFENRACDWSDNYQDHGMTSLQACKNLCTTYTLNGGPCNAFTFAKVSQYCTSYDRCYCYTCHRTNNVGDFGWTTYYDTYKPQTSEVTLVEPTAGSGKCTCTYAIPGGTCDGSSDFKHYVIQTDDVSTLLPAPEPAKVGLRQLETYEKYGFSVSERTCTTPINPTTYPYDGLEDCLQMCLHTDLCQFVEVNGNCKIMQGCSAFSYTGTLYEYDHFERMKECPFPPCNGEVGWDDMYVKVPGKTVTSSSVTTVAASNFEMCRYWCDNNDCAAFVYGTSYCRAYSSVVETSDSEYDLYIKIEPTKYDYGYKMVSATDCISTSPSYIEINSGTCESNGYTKVRSAQECDEAAETLGVISSSPATGFNALYSSYALGNDRSSCSISESLYYGSKFAYWNTDEGTGSCGNEDFYSKDTCICVSKPTSSLISTYHEDEIPGETLQDKTENCFRTCIGGKKYDKSSPELSSTSNFIIVTSGTCIEWL